MVEYKKIMFPIDYSEFPKQILPHVRVMLDLCGAELHLVYVAKKNEIYFEDKDRSGQAIKISEAIAQYKDQYFKGIENIKTYVLDGIPEEELIKYIENENIDLVIMPSSRRTALGKAVFGSVAQKLAIIGRVPTLLVHPLNDKFVGEV